ncbi:MAG: AAA family ATPase [Candidatus Methanoperedens sp.]|nr:AAA family ATPase [Candidatus Methanoperedens sp.]
MGFEPTNSYETSPLDPKLKVFVGAYGSGKSTVLDAIAIMLSWALSRIGHSGTSGRQIMESDITNDKSTSSISYPVKLMADR